LTRSAPLAFDTAASPLPVRPGARAIAHIKFTMSDRWNRSRDGTERFRSGFEFGIHKRTSDQEIRLCRPFTLQDLPA
ncbi:MAG: hypothetical protein J4N76_11230, partial [Chloroflexi bacterium]|nr:hypothetical protein [Chloroflexota bacterium]